MEKNKCQRHAQTIMIGALARIEEKFGDLWGHGKDDSELSNEEVYWQNIWLDLRTSILDLGNDLIKDLDDRSYKYSYTFKARKLGNDNSKRKEL